MNPDNIPPGLRRLCTLVRAGAALGAVLIVVLLLGLWTDPEWTRQFGTAMAGLDCERVTVGLRMRWLGAAVSLLPMSLGLVFFGLLWRLFGAYGAGRALTPAAQHLLQRLALALLAIALTQPLLRGAYSVVMTLDNPVGERLLVLGFGSDDYLATIVALALLAVATVMRQAVQAAEENRGFV